MTKQNMGAVFLDGWYGQGNTGDDALLLALSSQLKDIFSSVEVIVPSKNKGLGIDQHSSFVRVREYGGKVGKLARFTQLAATSRYYCRGGGDITHFTSAGLRQLAAKTAIAKMLGKRPALLGVGLAEATQRDLGPGLRTLIRSCEFIWARDTASARLMAVVDGRTLYAPDPTLLSSWSESVRSAGEVPSFSVNIMDFAAKGRMSHYDQNKFIDSLAQALRRVAERHGLRIQVVSFCIEDDKVSLELAQLLRSRLAPDQVVLHQYCPNPIVQLRRWTSSHGALCSRFHSQVFAYRERMPFSYIPYHPKLRTFADDVGMPKAFSYTLGVEQPSIELLLEATIEQNGAPNATTPVDNAQRLVNEAMAHYRHMVLGSA